MHGRSQIDTFGRISSGQAGQKQDPTTPTTFIPATGWATRICACFKEYSFLAFREDMAL